MIDRENLVRKLVQVAQHEAFRMGYLAALADVKTGEVDPHDQLAVEVGLGQAEARWLVEDRSVA